MNSNKWNIVAAIAATIAAIMFFVGGTLLYWNDPSSPNLIILSGCLIAILSGIAWVIAAMKDN